MFEVKYIARTKGREYRKKVTHHMWKGTDTVCRMASTGGLNLEKYSSADPSVERGSICKLCISCKQGRRNR